MSKKYFKLQLKGKEYKVETQKLLHILSCLESKQIEDISCSNINFLLEKYGLLDEIFLNNINKNYF